MVASESQGVQSGGIQTQKIIPVLFQAMTIILQPSSSCTRQAVLGTQHNTAQRWHVLGYSDAEALLVCCS